ILVHDIRHDTHYDINRFVSLLHELDPAQVPLHHLCSTLVGILVSHVEVQFSLVQFSSASRLNGPHATKGSLKTRERWPQAARQSRLRLDRTLHELGPSTELSLTRFPGHFTPRDHAAGAVA